MPSGHEMQTTSDPLHASCWCWSHFVEIQKQPTIVYDRGGILGH